jgi:2-(1,2-epoxy-1,2-dihydrophenyl)acetyl-CoA isomerase
MSVLDVEQDGPVVTLRLNRPEALNALDAELRTALADGLVAAGDDPAVRVVLLRGSRRAFSAGGDVTAMTDRDANGWTAGMLNLRRLMEQVVACPKPIVAAVEGVAVGSGFSLALACDLIVASTDARFGMAFIRRGLVPDGGATYFLARQVGLYRAKEMALTGRFVPAGEAFDLGIVSRLWSPDVFEAELCGLIGQLATAPTVAAGMTKRMVNRAFETDLSTALELETLGQAVAGGTQDHAESIRAWRDKRDAAFEGR